MKSELENRRYFQPPATESHGRPSAEDLHAWSIYRQNINTELSTSALGDNPKSAALPYGNFALRPHQVDAIIHRAQHANVTASSELLNSTNAITYLKFGLPRVSVPNLKSAGSSTPDTAATKARLHGSRGGLQNVPNREKAAVSGFERNSRLRKSRSELDVRRGPRMGHQYLINEHPGGGNYLRDTGPPLRSPSEGDINRIEHFRPLHRGPGSSESAPYRTSPERGGMRDHRYMAQRSGDVQLSSEFAQMRFTEEDPGEPTVKRTKSVVERVQQDMERNYVQTPVVIQTESRPGNIYQGSADGLLTPDVYSDPAGPALLNEKYFSANHAYLPSTGKASTRKTEPPPGFYPSLQVRSLSLASSSKKNPEYSFSAVTFEAKGGDLVGILSGSDKQGTDLLEALVDRRGRWGTTLKGAITYNGINVDTKTLAERAVYADINLDFNPNMSLKQTILFMSHLAEPGEANRKTDTRGRIEALIGDLGLSNVAATRVAELTKSEKQRLNIACQLLSDPDLVLLDRPTHNMDIFDTFFLVEYLRQWALRGRIVIITIQPPTFEIFSMLTRVAIISNGRTLYSGKRKEMISYFESLDYLCPTQKNPADYYVDLVSVDQSTKEAHEESVQRIDYLSSVFTQRQPKLSDLSQPGILPPKIWKAGFVWQIIVLWIRALIFNFPYNLLEAMYQIIQSVGMSIMIGVIFFGLSRNQASADDRTGLFYTILTIGIWPMIIHIIQKEYSSKKWLYKEVQDKMYAKGAYLIAKVMYSIPITAISIGAYIVPVYFMSRLRQDEDFRPFGLYVAMMYLHVLAWRATAKLLVYAIPSPRLLAWPLSILAVLSFLTSGYPVHPTQLWKPFQWYEWISPTQYAYQELARNEFSGVGKLDCQKIPVQVGGLPILTSPNCGLESGDDAKSFLYLSRHFPGASDLWKPYLAVGIYDLLMFLLSFFAFLIVEQKPARVRVDD